MLTGHQGKSFTIDNIHRPLEVNMWLKNGHKYGDMPRIADSATYTSTWLKWWMHLQPEWRGTWPTVLYDAPDDATWPALHKGRPNGIFILLLAFSWWGVAVSDMATKTNHQMVLTNGRMHTSTWIGCSNKCYPCLNHASVPGMSLKTRRSRNCPEAGRI